MLRQKVCKDIEILYIKNKPIFKFGNRPDHLQVIRFNENNKRASEHRVPANTNL